MMMAASTSSSKESRSLQSILGARASIPFFFDAIWQRSCGVFPLEGEIQSTLADGQYPWKEDCVLQNPYKELIRQGWHVLIDLLEKSREDNEQPLDLTNGEKIPLLFKNQVLLSQEERARYGSSLFAAYLDGCSVVINHSDSRSPWIAALCQDLQASFPHAYANAYLTPPSAQTVPPHADDRDVFVIQVVGSKHWKVYHKIPVPYPYPDEQVGKDGLDVPDEVLSGPVMIERTLRPGDVLYMPRGYVHQAKAVDDQLSFHVTVALATHDWTLAGLVSNAAQKILTSNIDYRLAVARQFGRQDLAENTERDNLQCKLDEAMDMLRQEITVESIHNALRQKYERHNQRAWSFRSHIIQEANAPSKSKATQVVGRIASDNVRLLTMIRKATDEEKASVPATEQPRGLNVREETYNGIIHILQQLRNNPSLHCRVKDLNSLLPDATDRSFDTICDLTLLSFARQCVELGALAVVPE